MQGIGRGRQIAALHLVLPLCPGFDPRQSVLDRIVDGAVVAGLEVQKLVVFERPQLRP